MVRVRAAFVHLNPHRPLPKRDERPCPVTSNTTRPPARPPAGRFLEGDGPEADARRNRRLKLIPRVVVGPWLVRQVVGTTPVLLGQKVKVKYFRWVGGCLWEGWLVGGRGGGVGRRCGRVQGTKGHGLLGHSGCGVGWKHELSFPTHI
jgi:hypothetical protein